MNRRNYKTILTIVLFCFGSVIFADSSQVPYDEIKNSKVFDLKPIECLDYKTFIKEYTDFHKSMPGLWSTSFKNNKDLIEITISNDSSSELNGYNIYNSIDKKINTAWVEGKSGDGIDEWIKINITAKINAEDVFFVTSFFGLVPGYAKSNKTWLENNRIKTALLIIASPGYNNTNFVVCRLHLRDFNGMQIFRLPLEQMKASFVSNEVNYKITIWVVIKEIYKGNKYSDTCISELYARGGITP